MPLLWPSNPFAPDLNGEDAKAVIRIVWEWISNDDCSDTGDLIFDLERAGYPCPDDLKEND